MLSDRYTKVTVRNMLSAKPMFVLCTLMVAISAGCASRASMDELEQEAMQTGDWSAVEQRQRIDRRRGLNNPDNACDHDSILHCSKKGVRETCECVTPNVVRRR